MTIALRPRNPWEAIDLGFDMVRSCWKSLLITWLLVLLPVALIINVLCWNVPWLAPLLIWWLKPMFDRIPLYMLSRSAFGDKSGIRETLSAVLPLWRKSAIWDLTLGRIDMARSFNMPVRDLEGLRGKPRRQRLKVLQKKTRNGAVWLTLVCLHMELVLNIGLYLLLFLLLPQNMQTDFFKLFFAPHQSIWMDILQNLFYLVVITIIEPFYVAAGFALYLNRRTILEGWDIEIAFRHLAERRLAMTRSFPGVATLATLLVLGMLSGGLLLPAQAMAATTIAPPAVMREDTPEKLKQQITSVLQQPEFQTHKVERHWKYTGQHNQTKQPNNETAWQKFLASLIPKVAQIFEWLLWLLLAAIIGWLILNHKRWLGWLRISTARMPIQPAPTLFGLDIQPESLPDNISQAAWKLWQDGQQRLALSLLYRGALAYWIAREKIALGANATEGDCMRLFRAGAKRETGDYFCRLTLAWQHTAYAGRQPPSEEMQQLCRDWDQHFRTAA